jgi:alkylresorcinol/alkylpyrone synthase
MIPSLDAYLVDDLGLRPDVRRLPITELGCGAGAAALARARDFLLGFPAARALVVAVELPSLSMQRADLSPANLVATALFGDGAAAAVLAGGDVGNRGGGVRGGGAARGGGGGSVTILETLSHIWPRSTYALGFDLKDDGFHSVLSKDVPALLRSAST